MNRTYRQRRISRVIARCRSAAVRARITACQSAVGTCDDVAAEMKALVRQTLVSGTHDVSPCLHCIVGGVFELFVVGISVPRSAYVIGGAAAEVTVLDVACRTGFSERIKAADFGASGGTACAVDRGEKHAVHNRGCVFLHNPDAARRGVFKHCVALLVGNQRVARRRVVYASAAEHNVSGSHFEHRHAVGKSADRHRREVVVLFVELDGESLGQEFVALLRRDIADDSRGDAVCRNFKTLDSGNIASVMSAVISRPLDCLTVVPDGHRFVGDRSGVFQDAQFNGQTVRAERLDGRTRLSP